MQVAEAVGKNNILLDLDIGVSSLYLLAAPNTPPKAIEAVAAHVKAGDKVTNAEVKEIINEAKAPKSGSAKMCTASLPPPSPAFQRANKLSKKAREELADALGAQARRFEDEPSSSQL